MTNNFLLHVGHDQDGGPLLLSTSKQSDGSHVLQIQSVQGAVGRVSAGAGAPGQSLKTFSSSGGVSINSGATVNVYTTTAGKTLYITDLYISADSAAPILVQVKAGATVIFEGYVSTTAPMDMTGIETQPNCGSGVALTIVFPTAAGKNGSYFIGGFEQ